MVVFKNQSFDLLMDHQQAVARPDRRPTVPRLGQVRGRDVCSSRYVDDPGIDCIFRFRQRLSGPCLSFLCAIGRVALRSGGF